MSSFVVCFMDRTDRCQLHVALSEAFCVVVDGSDSGTCVHLQRVREGLVSVAQLGAKCRKRTVTVTVKRPKATTQQLASATTQLSKPASMQALQGRP